MAEVRQRKPGTAAGKAQAPTRSAPPPQGLSTTTLLLGVIGITSITGLAIAGTLHFLDPLAYLNLPSASSSAAALSSSAASAAAPASPAPATPSGLRLTDAQLAAHDGSDPSLPLYIAINGTIYDVSAGRTFYGPGGHYAHFAGRDATRAWVSECFEGEEQLTHDMRGLYEMFMPKYMDETLEDAAAGKGMDEEAEIPDQMRMQAQAAVEKIGKVSEEEREERRERDVLEAKEQVEKALKHWVGFFGGSGKYAVVGHVERDQAAWEKTAPAPPSLCEKALKKKPVKGGKLENAMGSLGKMMGNPPGAQV